MMLNYRWLRLLIPVLFASIIVESDRALAQIVPDDTLGAEGSRIVRDVLIRGERGDRIEGGAARGVNLFHSFEAFNVLGGERVYFDNPAAIENIFSRVTGNDVSDIRGTLGVDGLANLYLLNPNGILFGPNARLDIGGSFLATTADRFLFPNGEEFSAVDPQAPPLLMVNVPIGLQHGANPQGLIESQGILSTGGDLTLDAGRLELQGQLQAGGDLVLRSQSLLQVRDTPTAPLIARSGGAMILQGNQEIDIWALQHPTQTPFISGGDLLLISDGEISTDAHFTSGGDFSIRTLAGDRANFLSRYDPIINAGGNYDVGDYTGASMQVTAGGDITYGTVVINAIDPAVNPTSAAFILSAGGDIIGTGNISSTLPIIVSIESFGGGNLTLGDIETSGGTMTLFTSGSGNITAAGSFVTAPEFALGDSGNISVFAGGSIFIGESVFSGSDYADGGSVTLIAGGDITVPLGIFTFSSFNSAPSVSVNPGHGGDITLIAGGNITTPSLRAFADTFSTGRSGSGGNITLIAGETIITEFLDSSSSSRAENGGSGGTISLQANGLIQFSSADWGWESSSLGSNNGALRINTLTEVQITGSLSVEGADLIIGDRLPPRTFQLPNTITTEGGDVRLFLSGNLTLDNIDIITSQAEGSSGTIEIRTPETLRLVQSRLFTSIEPGRSGRGGDIILDVGTLQLENFSLIDTATFGLGNAGNVEITAQDSIRLDQSDITSITAGEGDAGRITLRSQGALELTDLSIISTATRMGSTGDGGNINLQVGSLSLLDGSQLQAFTQGEGDSGNIVVRADQVRAVGRGDNGIRSGIFTSTDSFLSGRGGDIRIFTSGTVRLDAGGVFSAQTRSQSRGGDIEIQADRVRLLNGGQMFTSTVGQGRAGNIILEVNEAVEITGTDPEPGTPRLPEFTCPTIGGAECSLLRTPDVEFSTRIPYLTLRGPQATGVDEYQITITTPGTRAVFDVDQGGRAIIDSQGRQTGRLWGIDTAITLLNAQGTVLGFNDDADVLLGGDGSFFSNSPSNIFLRLPTGQDAYLRAVFPEPGTYILRVDREAGSEGTFAPNPYLLHVSLEPPPATGRVVDTSAASGLFARSSSTGTAGSIRVTTPELSLESGGEITVSALSGQAGSVWINTRNLFMNNGQITAETGFSPANGQSANIRLQGLERLLMRNNSLLSARALGDADGGNILIDAREGFVIGVPSENNDIVAIAQRGTGGNVTIRANLILGFTDQLPELSFEQLRGNTTNDIIASSQFGAPGTLVFDVQNRNLEDLPEDLLDASDQIARQCGAGSDMTAEELGEFVITGRGGLPFNPDDLQNSEIDTTELIHLESDAPTPTTTPSLESDSAEEGSAIIEAQGWTVGTNGEVRLVAEAVSPTPHRAIAPPEPCIAAEESALH